MAHKSVKERKEEIVRRIVDSSTHFTDAHHDMYKEKMVTILLEFAEKFIIFWHEEARKGRLQTENEEDDTLAKALYDFVCEYVESNFVKE